MNNNKNNLPDDDYFKKIWNDIEYKSPIGEKYYLRYIFISLILLFFTASIVIFFLEFNKNVSLLNTLIQRNQYLDKVKSLNIFSKIEYNRKNISKDLEIELSKGSKYLINYTDNNIIINLYKGEFLINKKQSNRDLNIKTSMFTIKSKKGRISILILKDISKIISITESNELILKDKTYSLVKGKEYYIIKSKLIDKNIF